MKYHEASGQPDEQQEQRDFVRTAERRVQMLGFLIRAEEQAARRCAGAGDFEAACRHQEQANRYAEAQRDLMRSLHDYRVALCGVRRRPTARIKKTPRRQAVCAPRTISPTTRTRGCRQSSPKPSAKRPASQSADEGPGDPRPDERADDSRGWSK